MHDYYMKGEDLGKLIEDAKNKITDETIINKILKENPHLTKDDKDEIRKIKMIELKKEYDLLDIHAFLDGVELYFQPDQYGYLFDEKSRPLHQDANAVSHILSPVELINSGDSIVHAGVCTNTYDENKLNTFLKRMEDTFIKANSSCSITLGSNGHEIHIGFNINEGKWMLLDANGMPSKRGLDISGLSKEIFTAFSLGRALAKELIITENFYTLNNNEIINTAIKDIKNDVITEVSNAQMTIKDVENRTWLHEVCNSGEIEVVKALIKNGANPNEKSIKGWTPLHYAVNSSNLESVKILLSIAEIQPNIQNSSGATPLHIAVNFNNVESVKMLLENAKIQPDIEDENGATPLHFAVKNGNTEIINLLCAKQVDLDKKVGGWSPLHIAVQTGNLTVIQLLLEKGAKFSLSDSGVTPLEMARQNNQANIVEFLNKYLSSQSELIFDFINKADKMIPLIGISTRRVLLNSIKKIAGDTNHPNIDNIYALMTNSHKQDNPIQQLLELARDRKDKKMTKLCFDFIQEHSKNENSVMTMTSSKILENRRLMFFKPNPAGNIVTQEKLPSNDEKINSVNLISSKK